MTKIWISQRQNHHIQQTDYIVSTPNEKNWSARTIMDITETF